MPHACPLCGPAARDAYQLPLTDLVGGTCPACSAAMASEADTLLASDSTMTLTAALREAAYILGLRETLAA